MIVLSPLPPKFLCGTAKSGGVVYKYEKLMSESTLSMNLSSAARNLQDVQMNILFNMCTTFICKV